MIVLKEEKRPLHVDDLGKDTVEFEMDDDFDFDDMEVELDGDEY